MKRLLALMCIVSAIFALSSGCKRQEESNPYLNDIGMKEDSEVIVEHAVLGETARYNDLYYTVVEKGKAQMDPAYSNEIEEGFSLKMFEIKVENKGESPFIISAFSDFSILDDAERAYSPSTKAIYGAQGMIGGTVEPGGSITGKIAFELADDIEKSVMMITPNALNDAYILIKLY